MGFTLNFVFRMAFIASSFAMLMRIKISFLSSELERSRRIERIPLENEGKNHPVPDRILLVEDFWAPRADRLSFFSN